MNVTTSDIDFVESYPPDEKGSFCEIYLRPNSVLKRTSKVTENQLEHSISELPHFTPDTGYTRPDSDFLIIKQERVDQVYRPENREELDTFLEDTLEIVRESFTRDLKLDYKPPNFGQFNGEALYIDNHDIGSFLNTENPFSEMAHQLKRHLENQDYYSATIPSPEEINSYWCSTSPLAP